MDGRRFIDAVFSSQRVEPITQVVMNLPNDAVEYLGEFIMLHHLNTSQYYVMLGFFLNVLWSFSCPSLFWWLKMGQMHSGVYSEGIPRQSILILPCQRFMSTDSPRLRTLNLIFMRYVFCSEDWLEVLKVLLISVSFPTCHEVIFACLY